MRRSGVSGIEEDTQPKAVLVSGDDGRGARSLRCAATKGF
jgi:hypothetical protein